MASIGIKHKFSLKLFRNSGVYASIDFRIDAPVYLWVDTPIDFGVDTPIDFGVDTPIDFGIDTPIDFGVDTPIDFGIAGCRYVLRLTRQATANCQHKRG